MTDPTPRRGRRAVRFAILAVLAIAGWRAGTYSRGHAPAAPAGAAAPRTATAAPPRAAPSLAPAGASSSTADVLHPRPAGEWQGMLVDLSDRQYCESSSYCGLALACLDDHKCGPCQRDDQCAAGEVCALDHCVLAANAGCRVRAECDGGAIGGGGGGRGGDAALCVLSGLSGGEPRGNGEMRAFCRSSSGGERQDAARPDARRAARVAAAAAQQPVAPPISARDLRARLDAR